MGLNVNKLAKGIEDFHVAGTTLSLALQVVMLFRAGEPKAGWNEVMRSPKAMRQWGTFYSNITIAAADTAGLADAVMNRVWAEAVKDIVLFKGFTPFLKYIKVAGYVAVGVSVLLEGWNAYDAYQKNHAGLAAAHGTMGIAIGLSIWFPVAGWLVIVACAGYLYLYPEREADLQNWLAQTLWGDKAEREKWNVLGVIPMDDLMPYRNSGEEIQALNNILK